MAHSNMSETRLLSQVVDEVIELGRALRRAGAAVARGEGQTFARWEVLSTASEGDMTVSHVARRLGLARQGVHRIVDLLVEEGLVTWGRNPRNARSPLVRLTPKAKRVLARLERAARRYRQSVARKTTRRHLAALRGGLRNLAQAVEGVDGDTAG